MRLDSAHTRTTGRAQLFGVPGAFGSNPARIGRVLMVSIYDHPGVIVSMLLDIIKANMTEGLVPIKKNSIVLGNLSVTVLCWRSRRFVSYYSWNHTLSLKTMVWPGGPSWAQVRSDCSPASVLGKGRNFGFRRTDGRTGLLATLSLGRSETVPSTHAIVFHFESILAILERPLFSLFIIFFLSFHSIKQWPPNGQLPLQQAIFQALLFNMKNSFIALALVATLLLSSVNAHVKLKSPMPYRATTQEPQNAVSQDYDMKSPLDPSGNNFPCKGYHKDKQGTQSLVDWAAGSTQTMTFEGSATHGGGSCQASLSEDGGATWKVMKSFLGGCPLKDASFTVPKEAKSGHAIFAW